MNYFKKRKEISTQGEPTKIESFLPSTMESLEEYKKRGAKAGTKAEIGTIANKVMEEKTRRANCTNANSKGII